MKRLSLPTPTSLRQRGFFRVTALLFSAGLISAGIVTTQQVKAHQASHVKRVLAIKKLAVKDCGCRLLVPKTHTARLYQTAADADGNNYEQAVSLKAGLRLALGVSDPAGSVQPGGTWDASFGTVDASGTYTAPSFTPPEGLDRIHYLDPQSNDVYIDIRVLPNPDIPDSDQTPYVTMDDVSFNAMRGGPSPQAQQPHPAGTSDSLDETLAPTSQTVVVQSGETPPPPLQINGTTPLIGETINGANVLVLPALFGDGTTSAIYAQPLDETPQVVTLTPNVAPPSGPCTSGETAVYGPIKTTYVAEPGQVNLADFKVDTGFKADAAKYFGANLAIGAIYHVQGKFYDWKQERTKYVYACSNKKWVFEYTRECDRLATSLTTTPPFAILGTGYPRGNAPRPYGPEACH